MRRKRNHYRTKRGWKCRLPGKKEAMIFQMRTGAGEDVEKKMNEENTVLTRKKKNMRGCVLGSDGLFCES